MEHIHLLVSTFDTSNVAVAHNLRSCSRPRPRPRPGRPRPRPRPQKSGLDRSRDQDQVSRPTSLVFPLQRCWLYTGILRTLCPCRRASHVRSV